MTKVEELKEYEYLWHRKIPAERDKGRREPQSGNPLSKYAPPFVLKWKRAALQRQIRYDLASQLYFHF